MNIAEMTSREMRNANPTEDMLIEAANYLRSLGWKFSPDLSAPKFSYGYGWWINQNHPDKCRACGDPGNVLVKAWDTVKCYVAV